MSNQFGPEEIQLFITTFRNSPAYGIIYDKIFKPEMDQFSRYIETLRAEKLKENIDTIIQLDYKKEFYKLLIHKLEKLGKEGKI